MGFAYSPTNRLTSATGPWGTLTWSYDGVGNRTSEVATPPGGSAATDTYAYPGTSNRTATVTRGAQKSCLALPIHALAGRSGDRSACARSAELVPAQAGNNAGNLISDSRLGSVYAYTYNNANRLKTVAYEGNLKGTYNYNGRAAIVRA